MRTSIDKRINYHVISHTHWDREWYQPLALMRYRLVDMIDHLLEIYDQYPEYVFHLDAQTICLEDYLMVRSENKERLKVLIKRRSLLVGPWYVQNDFFLTSGEATIRNLLIGRKLAEEFGHCDNIGYVPDQFGLISQLPQILQGFGIDNCIFGRGYPPLEFRGENANMPCSNEFTWRAPDGSEVLAYHLSSWYNNAQRFSAIPERAEKYLQAIVTKQKSRTNVPELLLMNGVDHLEAQENLLPILDRLQNGLLPGEHVFQSTMRQFLNEVKAYVEIHKLQLGCISGELRYGSSGSILQGTLSAWTAIKSKNVEAQALLELLAEPSGAMVSAWGNNPRLSNLAFSHYLWKQLIKNHPHDTICACSNDQVQRDCRNRLDNVILGSLELVNRNLRQVMERLDRKCLSPNEYILLVCNSLPFARRETILVRLYLPIDEKIKRMKIVTPDGNDIPFEVVGKTLRKKTTHSPINLPGNIKCMVTDILLKTDSIPGTGYHVYRLVPGEGKRLQTPRDKKTASVLENEFLKIFVNDDGRVDMLEKDSGHSWVNLIDFTEETDVGSAYNFRPLATSDLSYLSNIATRRVVAVHCNSISSTVTVEYSYQWPGHYNFSTCNKGMPLENKLLVTYVLNAGSRRLDMKFKVSNHSIHHRLRMIIHTNILSDLSNASSPFDLISRNKQKAHNGEKHNGDQPNSGVISIVNSTCQISIFNRGLHEYEHINTDISITLLRSFTGITDHEQSSASNLFTDNAEEFSCPESAQLGDFELSAAIRLGKLQPTDLINEFYAFLAPLMTFFDSADNHKFCGGRPCVQDSELQELFFRDLSNEQKNLPFENRLFLLEGPAIVTAIKTTEDQNGYLIRLYHLEQESSKKIIITFFTTPRAVECVSMDECRVLETLPLLKNTVELDIPPKRIVTIKVI